MIYNETNYQLILSQILAERKSLNKQFRRSDIAEAARMQAPQFSKVLHGQAHFSADQLYLVMDALELLDYEREYIELCYNWTNCEVQKRKGELFSKIEQLRYKHLKASQFVKGENHQVDQQHRLESYYRDHFNLVIHAALDLEVYRQDLHLLAVSLGIPFEKVQDCIQTLLSLDLIESDGYRPKAFQMNLDRDSQMFKNWHREARIQSLSQISRLDSKKYYNYAVVFTADEATRLRFQQMFLDFLSQMQEIAAVAPQQNIYQIGFEIVPWT